MHLNKDLVAAVAGSSVVAGIVAALVSLRTNARNIKVTNVTSERTKWRDKVREKALEVHKAISDGKDLAELHSQFSLILNPLDPEDRAILRLIKNPAAQESRDATVREFVERVSLLIKHDWERAKWESSSIFTRRPFRPRRVAYHRFNRMKTQSNQS